MIDAARARSAPLGPAPKRGQIAESWMLTQWLVRNRARAISRDLKSRSLYGIGLASALGTCAAIFLGTLGGVRVLESAGATGLIATIPAWAFLVYLFADILIAFGQALGDLYLADDLPMLFAAPVRTASIVIAKFVLGVVQNEAYAAIFLLPFALAYVDATGAPAWAYGAAVLAVFVYPAILYAPLIVITIAALRFIPARVAKEGLWLLGASVPTAFWFLSFYQIAHIAGSVGAMRLPAVPAWLPSTWAGDMLASFAVGANAAAGGWLALLLGMTFIVCPLVLVIVARGLASGWSAGAAPARSRPISEVPRRPASPVGALVRKDAIVFSRSPQLWFNHITAIAFVVFLLVGHDVQTPLLPLTPQLAMLQIGFVAVFGALNPGMTALSLEHQSIWLLRSAPLTPRDIIKGKVIAGVGQSAAVAIIGALALGEGYHFSFASRVALVAFAASASLSAICVGLAFDAAHPSFTWENPNHINRGLRMIVPFLTNVAVIGTCAMLLFALRIIVHRPTIALAAGLSASIGVQLLAATLSLRNARRDVAALEV